MTPPLLSLSACVLGFGRRAVAGPFDLEVRRGDLLLVAGPNGAGKSTLLKTLLGALLPVSGEAHRTPGLRLSYVPQRAALDASYPLTLAEVVRMGFHVSPWGDARAEALARMEGILVQLDLGSLSGRLYRELSGGQKQRALLARALVSEPDLILLDEPAEGLDLGAEQGLEEALRQSRSERGVALVHVTHLQRPVREDARVFFLAGGRGEVGPAPEILTPARLTAAYGHPVRVDPLGDQRLRVMEDAR